MTTTTTQTAETFVCSHCNYRTADSYTVEVINDLTGVCPICETEATSTDFTAPRIELGHKGRGMAGR